MKILDFSKEGDRLLYKTPQIRMYLPENRCGNISMLLLLTQWIETEVDCRTVLKLLGREASLGHISHFELILLFDRVDVCLEKLFRLRQADHVQITKDQFMCNIYEEFFLEAELVRADVRMDLCDNLISVWDVIPDLGQRVVEDMKIAREISRYRRDSL